MKRVTKILSAAMAAVLVLAGAAVSPVLAAETTQLDGMTYTVTKGTDGSVIMTPQLPAGVTLPYYDSASGQLYVATLAVIFDAKSQIGLPAYQDCFYYARNPEAGKKYPDKDGKTGNTAEMKKWNKNAPQSNVSPSYDRLYPQGIIQVMTWKYYPQQAALGTAAYEDVTGKPLAQFMAKYVDPGYQLIYWADDGHAFEANGVSNGNNDTWWHARAEIGLDQYAINSKLVSFDLAGQVGMHGLGHAVETIMSTLTRATWDSKNQNTGYLLTIPWTQLNDWEKFSFAKFLRPDAPKKDSDFADLHGTYGATNEYEYLGWDKPGDVGGMPQLRYEAAWFAAVPHLKEYLACFWLDYYPEANKVPKMAEIKGLKVIKPGDKIGEAVYTDIKAYINGAEIPAYSIDGALYVLAGDLKNYGFDAAFDGTKRTTTITLAKGKAITPLKVTAAKGKVGAKIADVLHTDIKLIIAGKEMASKSVNGGTAIPFAELAAFGEVKSRLPHLLLISSKNDTLQE